MIPYDDLVVALTAWRARQGLPVAQPVVAAPTAPAAPARVQAAPPPTARPAAAPARPAPPQAPPDAGDFEEGALVEDDASYDAGDDYVMQLGGDEQPVEATEIGSAPEPAPAPRRGKRPDGW